MRAVWPPLYTSLHSLKHIFGLYTTVVDNKRLMAAVSLLWLYYDAYESI